MLPIKIELPEHFLDEEVRCGYTVTEKMKKIWAVELDLLNEFQKVCKQYDLKYYAIGGTLLGTIRHKGYIPWDDDIDIAMFREDYDKLVSIAPRVFSDPYDFMVSGKIEHFFRGHAQLRNRMTTGILSLEFEQKYSFNQGIWIDIFPLDGVPEQNSKERFPYFKLSIMKKCLVNRARLTHKKLKSKALHTLLLLWEKITGDNFQLAHNRYEDEYRKMSDKYNEFVSFIEFINLPLDKYNWKKSDFEQSIEMPFEFISLPVPNGYDNVLRTQYGDYMKPAQVNNSFHGETIMDPEKPYTEYL